MSKRNIILFVVFFLIIGLIIYWVVAQPPETEPTISEEQKEEEKQKEIISEEELRSSDRAEGFFVSGGKTFPAFTKKLIIAPFKVKEGEEQTFSIWAKDPEGIEKVTATVSTDTEDKLIELELVEGTNEEGRWLGSWITKDISVRSSCPTVFQALNKEGEHTEMTISWLVER